MSIEGDAQKDLALDPQDADNVLGGRMLSKLKKMTHRAGPTTASSAVIINEPPLPGGPQDPSAEISQSDDPNC